MSIHNGFRLIYILYILFKPKLLSETKNLYAKYKRQYIAFMPGAGDKIFRGKLVHSLFTGGAGWGPAWAPSGCYGPICTSPQYSSSSVFEYFINSIYIIVLVNNLQTKLYFEKWAQRKFTKRLSYKAFINDFLVMPSIRIKVTWWICVSPCAKRCDL